MPSKIEWLNDGGARGETISPWVGCTPASSGCANCYAARQASRELCAAHKGLTKSGKWTGEVRWVDGVLDKPLNWQKPRRIFVCSMSDPFHESVPDEWLDKLFAVMALTPQHQYVLPTKRGKRMCRYADDLRAGERKVCDAGAFHICNPPKRMVGLCVAKALADCKGVLPNVVLGVSVSNQADADKQIPWLLKCPARWRIVSYEPALGPVDWRDFLKLPGMPDRIVKPMSRPIEYIPVVGIDLIIAGGESGPNARPSHPDWFRVARDQCAAAGVAFNFKQFGEWGPATANGPLPENGVFIGRDGTVRTGDWEFEDDSCMVRVGKRSAGRVLDGVEHKEWVK